MSELQKTESALVNDLEEFLRAFKDRTGNYKYFDRINNLMAANSTSLVVDYIDFDTFKPDLAKLITNEPDEMFDAFNRAIFNVLYEIHPDYANETQNNIKVRIGNYTVQKSLREINAEVINKLVGVSGMVVRSSEVKPLAKKIGYRCLSCGEITEAQFLGLVLKKPLRCGKCSEKELEMDPDTSIFIDFQMVRLQELPEDLPAGHLPHYLEVTIIGDLVDQCRPGDRILLTGIVRIEQEQLSQQMKTSLFRLRMEGNNIEYLGGRTADKDSRTIERLEISSEDEKHIFALARKNDAYDILISSYAPHVYGHEVIKEVILLLIVGSVTKRLEDGSTRRGDINVLLVGDPGTAKSEMLKFTAKIAPRGLYTSGRGSTAAGLTAAVIRDKSGIMMLEAGAVVLGDQGIVCIDEFDKIKPEDRSALHEVMEQQTCSVAKGGIVATLNARTSILAAANPLYGKYDPFKNITENVNLPIPLLTRFDIIYVIRDIPEKEKDHRVASHILELHRESESTGQYFIDIDLFSKYLAYSKTMEPKLTVEAIDKIKDYVDSDDAERAIYLIQTMLETAGVDVNTGRVDLGVLHGKPQSEISKLKLFMEIFNGLSGQDKNDVEEKNFINELIQTGRFSEDDAKNFLNKAMQNGQIYERRSGFYAKA